MSDSVSPGPDESSTSQDTFLVRRRSPWIYAIGGVVAIIIIVGVVIATTRREGSEKTAFDNTSQTFLIAAPTASASETAVINHIIAVGAEQNVKLKIDPIDDPVEENRAVSSGEVAATFEEREYLNQVTAQYPSFKVTATVPVWRWGFGIWSAQAKSPKDIPNGSTVTLSDNSSNEAQGLWVLERAGLIKFKPGTNPSISTVNDVASNPKNLKFELIDEAQQPRSLNDVGAAVGFNAYFNASATPRSYLIYNPPAPDSFAGWLVVSSKYRNTPGIQKLIQVFEDPSIQSFIANDKSLNNEILPGSRAPAVSN